MANFRLRYHFLTLIASLFILSSGSWPGGGMPSYHYFGLIPLDKLLHFLFSTSLTLFTIVGLKKQHYYSKQVKRPILSGMVYVLIITIVVEIIQLAVDGRSFELADIAFNSLGIFTGVLAFRLVYGKELFWY